MLHRRVPGYLSLLVCLPALAAGCSSSNLSHRAQGDTAGEMLAQRKTMANASRPASAFAQDYDEALPNLTAVSDPEPDRYLIKNATLTVEAPDVRRATGSIVADAKTAGGYVSDLHETEDALGTRSVTFVVRVPATKFDLLLQKFETQGKILDRQVTAEDVTEEFLDVQSRLRNLRATEARLLAHLEKTGRLSDTLMVEKEITRVRGDLDRLAGRIKFLTHRITFSTFNVTLHETPRAQAITPVETFSAAKIVSDSARSLVSFGQGMLALIIWLTVWSIVWLPPLLLGWWLYGRRRAAMHRHV